MGPRGLVRSLLVLRSLPRFAPHCTTLLNTQDRMESMAVARTEMANVLVEQKIKKAARAKIPPATRYKVYLGDLVYVLGEREAIAKKRC